MAREHHTAGTAKTCYSLCEVTSCVGTQYAFTLMPQVTNRLCFK